MNNANSDLAKQDQQLLAQVASQQMDLHSNVTIVDASRTLYGPGGMLEKLA